MESYITLNLVPIKVGGWDNAWVKFIRYAGGEVEARIESDSMECINLANTRTNVEIRWGYREPEDIVRLAAAMNALTPLVESISLFAPCLPYARNDRRFVTTGSHGINMFLNMVAGASNKLREILCLDVHNYNVVKDSPVKVVNLSPFQFIRESVRAVCMYNKCNVINVVYPDMGAAKRYCIPASIGGSNREQEKFVNQLYCKKERAEDGQVTINIEDWMKFPDRYNLKTMSSLPYLIVDDICDGGRTFIVLADKIREIAPDAKLYLYVTHGMFLFNKEELRSRFEMIFTTDSWSWWAGDDDEEKITRMNCFLARYQNR